VADSLTILKGNESKPAASEWDDYCWLNDGCPPSKVDASTASELSSGTMMICIYIQVVLLLEILFIPLGL